MESNKLLTFVITSVVTIILVATLLVPAVNMGAIETRQNENYVYRATDDLGDYVYAIDADNNLTLNDEIITLNTAATTDLNVGIASSVIGYSYRGTSSPSNWFYSTDAGIQLGSTPVTINADGSWNAVKNDVTTTGTTPVTKGFFINNNGEYAVYAGAFTSNTIRINPDDSLYIYSNYCQVTKDGVTSAMAFLAEYKGGEVSIIYADLIPSNGGSTTDVSSDITLSVISTSSELKDGVITFEGIHTSIVLTGYTWQGPLNIAAPLEYKAYVSSEYSPLLLILPIFCILALVVSAVRLVATRN